MRSRAARSLRRHLSPLAAGCLGAISLDAQVTAADYERARGLADRYRDAATGVADLPVWVDSLRLWYRVSVTGGHRFVLVEAGEGAPSKRPAFDHERLASSLRTAAPTAPTALTLPFTSLTFRDGLQRIAFQVGATSWECSLADYACAVTPPRAQEPGGAGAAGVRSPDGKRVAFISNYNVFVREADAPASAGTALGTDGSEGNPYVANTISWSPDSRRLVASRVRPGYRRLVRYVVSSPADQLQPKYLEREYAKPGDVLDLLQGAVFDLETKRQGNVDPALFPNPFSVSRAVWRRDGRAFTFEYNERGHQRYRVIEVDGSTGVARVLVDETSPTFIDYRRASGTLSGGGRVYRYDTANGAEIIWLSERDGWAHLYLYDGATGQVKNQVTKGEFVVRAVQRVDEARREIVFSAGGMDPKQDPYFAHYYRVGFDGTGLTPLTQAAADHEVALSPDGQLYVDRWSRLDLAPVVQLRRVRDGAVLLELERGDLTALAREGWKPPEVFTAKGRDGRTDIWGIVARPTRFDARRKYPVIEYIYAGPHGSFVPKDFSPVLGMQALAELGFIVVQIDGMGTANRSRAFHDVAWKNIGDAGFPDRMLWHRAFAATHAWYDITRVGIYGGSAGGQNALGGLLFHPEFYKVAVAFAGCHDNRMDKIWWNEQWMGYPIGPEYEASSNVVHAHRLQGRLLLVVPELDTNVDPSSTMQVVNALIRADKTFDLLVIPNEDHGGGRRGPSAAYGDRKLWDFFVRNLLDIAPPQWNAMAVRREAAVQGSGSIFEMPFEEPEARWLPWDPR